MPATKPVKRKEREGYIVLTGIAEKEGDQYVSYCPELGTSSCGDTVDEALKNLDDAIDVHIKALIEAGELFRFLRERHIRIDLPPMSDEQFVRCKFVQGRMFTIYQRPVPATETLG